MFEMNDINLEVEQRQGESETVICLEHNLFYCNHAKLCKRIKMIFIYFGTYVRLYYFYGERLTELVHQELNAMS